MIGQAVGNYRIVDKLGRGGMGVVYLAEHTMMGKKAAVKVLLPEFSNDKEVVGRFFNEAKAAARIRHPGIVDVFDFGFDADGGAYISMELLEGESLAARLDEAERIEEVAAVRIARQAARALSAAHKAGIIHRDLKPDNVFLLADPEVTGGERVKILDFGIAKLTVPGEAMFNTRAGMTMGTPYYMAPEQARGSADIDARADIYSLGCVLYHTVCGTPPFVDPEDSNPVAILRQHINEPPPPTRFHTDSVSAELEGMLMVMLAKHPDDRFQSMDEVVAAFDQLGYDIGTTYGTVTPVPGSLVAAPLMAAPLPPPPIAAPAPAEVDHEVAGVDNPDRLDNPATTLPGIPAFVEPTTPARDQATPARGSPSLENQVTLPPEQRPALDLRASIATVPRRAAVDDDDDDDDDRPTTIANRTYRPPLRADLPPPMLEDDPLEDDPDDAFARPPRSRWPLLIAGALVLLVVAVAGYAVFAGRSSTRTAAGDTKPANAASPTTAPGAPNSSSATEPGPDDVRVESIAVDAESIRVSITSTPSGAEVFRVFDGVRLGKTPYETTTNRSPGDLLLVLKLDDHQDVRLDVPLEKDFSAYVELLPAEPDSRHHRDRHDRGSSRRPGDPSARAPGSGEPTSSDRPEPALVAGTGTLRVVSEPSCEVIVDGKVRGSTPIAKIELPAGTHTLQLVNSRFGIDRSETIEIEPDKITKKRYVFPTGAP